MREYYNPNSYTVHLAGPDGRIVQIRSGQRVSLPEHYERYCARGFIKRCRPGEEPVNRTVVRTQHKVINRAPPPPRQSAVRPSRTRTARLGQPKVRVQSTRQQAIVGRRLNADGMRLLEHNLREQYYPISNNIGVGILSYERPTSLRRLVDSVLRTADLDRTTVFVSDDASSNPELLAYLDELAGAKRVVIIRNQERLGVAGNANRLLRCLSRFRHLLLLNDDVEVLQPGWETFYVTAAERTGFRHFMRHQPGVYGAAAGKATDRSGVRLQLVNDRPHGAVLYATNDVLEYAGYFDEDYGAYGMEHIDWSMRVHEAGLQEAGFFDVAGSEEYFTIHADPSAVADRAALLKTARSRFEQRVPGRRLEPSPKSAVPAITYVIPFRDIGRTAAIKAVVDGVRAQRYPVIEIMAVEQDDTSKADLAALLPIKHFLARDPTSPLFNKALAFNLGVSKATHEQIVLHDADMICASDYTARVAAVLGKHEGCHLGKTVIYTTEEAANSVCTTGSVRAAAECERVVGYYEGGSLACRRDVYWRVGGFNEEFKGYGCEDCDFYSRLAASCDWLEDRQFDL